MTLAPMDDLAGMLADISGAVSGRAAAAAAAIQADFAGRMAGVVRTAPRHMVAAILQGLKIEMSQLVAAVMQQAAAEIQARQQALIQSRSKPPGSDDESDEAQRPSTGITSPAAALVR
jgi:hypothetical protein